MNVKDYQRRITATMLMTSAVPLGALPLMGNPSEHLAVITIAVTLTLVILWFASRRLAWRFALRAEEEKGRQQTILTEIKKDDGEKAASEKIALLTKKAERMILLTEEHQQRAGATTSAAAKATESSTAIAGAIEEMKTAINEIGRQSEQAAKVASSAVEKAKNADQSMTALSENMNNIGSVVELIRAVAERTNLLALNATIEAARAGDHGRGFAVVAQEVKTLAKQTAEATGQIEGRITEVRASSQNAQTQMQAIQEVVQQINAITLGVKSSLQQQTAATGEIAKSAESATAATNNVTAGISHLLVTTEEIRRACEEMREKAKAAS